MKEISSLFVFGCAVILGAATPDFVASFDENGHLIDAKGAVVTGKYSQPGEPELVEGRKGKALRTGANADKTQGYNVVYSMPDILNPAAGTITVWVKPVDWDVNDKIYHVFFRAVGRDCDLLVYKVPGHVVRFAIGVTNKEGKKVWEQVSDNAGNWKRGEWHFVAACWEKGKITLTLDGRPTASRPMSVLPERFTSCGAGGLRPTQWTGGTPGTTYLDELKIFKRSLTPQEIKEIYLEK